MKSHLSLTTAVARIVLFYDTIMSTEGSHSPAGDTTAQTLKVKEVAPPPDCAQLKKGKFMLLGISTAASTLRSSSSLLPYTSHKSGWLHNLWGALALLHIMCVCSVVCGPLRRLCQSKKGKKRKSPVDTSIKKEKSPVDTQKKEKKNNSKRKSPVIHRRLF